MRALILLKLKFVFPLKTLEWFAENFQNFGTTKVDEATVLTFIRLHEIITDAVDALQFSIK